MGQCTTSTDTKVGLVRPLSEIPEAENLGEEETREVEVRGKGEVAVRT